jgi:hypothetical protein
MIKYKIKTPPYKKKKNPGYVPTPYTAMLYQLNYIIEIMYVSTQRHLIVFYQL